MNTFENYINIEAETINEFIKQHHPITLNEVKNDSFSRYDFTFYSAGTPNEHYTPVLDGICEVKTRKNSSTDYPEGIMIELDKLNAVAKAVADEKDEFHNINKTIKGFFLFKYVDKMMLFDIETITTDNLQFRKLPKQTATNNNEWVTKAVLIIPYDDAVLTI
ncbi:hypothetical protein [Psychroserpens mesophilus]|uniref:hypothetical protein n=1 Tax=Psychroserpens mesophilus TaxID=325473 RepID=UPI003D645B5F